MAQKIIKKDVRVMDTAHRDYCGGGCYATVRPSESFANMGKKVPVLIENQNKEANEKTKGAKKEEGKNKRGWTYAGLDLSDSNDPTWTEDIIHL